MKTHLILPVNVALVNKGICHKELGEKSEAKKCFQKISITHIAKSFLKVIVILGIYSFCWLFFFISGELRLYIGIIAPIIGIILLLASFIVLLFLLRQLLFSVYLVYYKLYSMI